MSKITLNPVGSLIDATTAKTTINDNFDTVEVAFDNTLSRDGTSPNQMEASLDMNSQQIINLPFPATDNSPLRFADLVEFNDSGTITNLPTGGTTGQPLAKNSNTNYDVTWAPITGTGNFVKSTSPTLVTPALGTPSSVNLTNGTNLPLTGIPSLGANIRTFLTTPTSATLAGAISDETGTGSLVFGTAPAISNPTITTPGIVGVSNASSATAGHVGEYLSNTLALGSAVNLTSGSPTTITTLALTAGDWDVGGGVFFTPAATTSITRYGGSLETTTNTFSTNPARSWIITQAAFVPTAGNFIGFPCPTVRVNVSGATTYYLTCVAVFTVSTLGGYGYIWARRVR